MIERGRSHVIYDDRELMQRIRKPTTIRVLSQLQYLFDARERKLLAAANGGTEMSDLIEGENLEYQELMRLVKAWLQPRVRVDFSRRKKNATSKSRRRVNRKRGKLG